MAKLFNCIHYCAIGGHTWDHECKPDPNYPTIPDCRFRSAATMAIMFFRVCEKHKRVINHFRENDVD